MSQQSLYLPGASPGSTQWKARTLQLVNWGGFHGHCRVDFAANATLLSGASGTGKSTMLDAYLALMMPSDTPFNGASNDAVAGRARNADQRNLISYLRGKTDNNREAGTGELRDQVLRGRDGATWGAIAMTFAADNGQLFTAMRLYFVPRSAARSADITMKLATLDGYLDLAQMEGAAADSHFDKRVLQTRFPGIQVHDGPGRFAQALFTKLGIGANGDGTKALRLLARIQAGHQIRTVDELYKSMVLEPPATFAAADNAVEHFADLEASYEAMLTEAEKAKVLSRVPDLHHDFVNAQAAADLIDTFGLHRDGDTPFLLWKMSTEQALLDVAEGLNRDARGIARDRHRSATADERRLAALLRDIQDKQDAAGGGAIKRLDEEITRLGAARDTTAEARSLFDSRTSLLNVTVDTEAELLAAQHTARAFHATFESDLRALGERQIALQGEQWPLANEKRELTDEKKSLTGREGRVTKAMHDARLQIAEAAGIDPAELPFVAELIDVAPEHAKWRKAIELTIGGVARVLLIDDERLDQVSRAIDPVRLRYRLDFTGVPAATHQDIAGDEERISGKLLYKPSPFSRWVQDRIRQSNTDALCVDSAAELNGGGRRVTVNGQTRQGRSGSHGESNSPNIIGFSSAERLEEIDTRLAVIEMELTSLDDRLGEVSRQTDLLHASRAAHQHILDVTWAHIDVDSLEQQISDLTAQRQRIIDASDDLRALQEEETRTEQELNDASRDKHTSKSDLDRLETELAELVDRKDQLTNHITRIEHAQTVTLEPGQAEHLTAEFAAVADPDDLGRFDEGITRLTRRLAERSKEERGKVQRAADTMSGIFATYQSRWFDPDLGTSVASYDAYRDILDNILATGLHERRKEWSRRLAEWSGQDLVPLSGAFESSIDEIEERLVPVNDILASLPFGANGHHLKIDLRRLHNDDVTKFQKELRHLSSGTTTDLPDAEVEARFKRLRKFIDLIRPSETSGKTTRGRDYFLDVRKHVVITAVAVDDEGVERSTYAALGGKSGGETQELVAFIVGAALRFQLGDEANARPGFAPVFLDEGFVKSDSEFAGRAVAAWKGLGFQLIVGAPLDKVTALEPHVDKVLTITKSAKGYAHITELTSPTATP